MLSGAGKEGLWEVLGGSGGYGMEALGVDWGSSRHIATPCSSVRLEPTGS